MIVQVHLWDLGQWHCQNSALTLAIFCEHNLKKKTDSHIIIWGSAITQRGKYALSQILKRGVSSQSRGKQIWNKYERNPTEKYSWVEIPNERKNFPKLEEDRKAAPQPHPVHLCEVGQWESASSRVEKANSVPLSAHSMKFFAAICHERKIPRSQALRSPNSQPCELGNLTRFYHALICLHLKDAGGNKHFESSNRHKLTRGPSSQ